MKKALKSALNLLLLGIGLTVIGTSCNESEKNDDSMFIATQADLDKATVPLDTAIFGLKYGPLSSAHAGPSGNVDSSFRDVYINMADPKGEIKKGTIITKRLYQRLPNNKRGKLFSLYAMIKREDGYDPTNANWEYVQLKFDASTDFTKNPNGILPEVGATRGKTTGCISCHASGGSDFLFVR